MRRSAVLAAVAVACLVVVPSLGAHGSWLTLKQGTNAVRAQMPLRGSLDICYDPNCYEDENGELYGGDRLLVSVKSGRYRVAGTGKSRVLNGQRRWQHFRVTGCGWVYSENTAVSFSFVYHGGTQIGYGNDPFPTLKPIDDC